VETGKDVMLNYCKTVFSNSAEHIYDCEDVERGLQKPDLNTDFDSIYDKYLDGHCPSAHGLTDYKGQCAVHMVDVNNRRNREDSLCKDCWRIAKDVQIKEPEVSKVTEFNIVGCIYTGDKDVTIDELVEEFTDFCEIKGWQFCGITTPTSNEPSIIAEDNHKIESDILKLEGVTL
jgi:hypothetical protein